MHYFISVFNNFISFPYLVCGGKKEIKTKIVNYQKKKKKLTESADPPTLPVNKLIFGK